MLPAQLQSLLAKTDQKLDVAEKVKGLEERSTVLREEFLQLRDAIAQIDARVVKIDGILKVSPDTDGLGSAKADLLKFRAAALIRRGAIDLELASIVESIKQLTVQSAPAPQAPAASVPVPTTAQSPQAVKPAVAALLKQRTPAEELYDRVDQFQPADVERAAEAVLKDIDGLIEDAPKMSKPMLQAHIGAHSAFLRLIQDAHPDVSERSGVGTAFSRLTELSSTYRPGWVPFLSRYDRSDAAVGFLGYQAEIARLQKMETSSRAAEAQTARTAVPDPDLAGRLAVEEFTKTLNGLGEDTDPLSEPHRKKLSKLLRAAITHLGDTDKRVVDAVALLPDIREGDSVLSRVKFAFDNVEQEEAEPGGPKIVKGPWKGKRILFLCGTPREERRVALEKKFGLAVLEWPDIGSGRDKSPRTVEALMARVGRAEFDGVIVARGFISHEIDAHTRNTCKAIGVRWNGTQSYGTGEFTRALSQMFA